MTRTDKFYQVPGTWYLVRTLYCSHLLADRGKMTGYVRASGSGFNVDVSLCFFAFSSSCLQTKKVLLLYSTDCKPG